MNTQCGQFALIVTALFVFVGCSSGDPAGEVGTDANKDVGTISEAFSEASCYTATPDATWDGRIPPGGGDSPARYSNPSCYKSDLVQITNWSDRLGDFTVKAAGTFPFVTNLTQAQCEGLVLHALVYLQTGPNASSTPIRTLRAGGQWWNNGLFNECLTPSVTFGGGTWRTDVADVDVFEPGQTYLFAATYRDASGATVKMHWESTPPTKGEPNQPCITVRLGYPWCDPTTTLTTCLNNECLACGANGQPACASDRADTSIVPVKGCASPALTVRYQSFDRNSDVCVPCGGVNQACCHNPYFRLNEDWYCAGGLTCQGNQAICQNAPATTTTPNPGPIQLSSVSCGGPSQACCSGSVCSLGFSCQSDTCVGGVDSCGYHALAVIDQCTSLDGTASNDFFPGMTSAAGCGSTPSDAVAAAVSSLASTGVPLSTEDNPQAGTCTYSVQQW